MIHVERYGAGEPRIVALHGWGGDHRDFAALARALRGRAELVCPDQPGYGASPPPADYALAAITDELAAACLPGDGEPPAVVLGYCSGVLPALLMARDRPDRVRRLVLLEPFAFVPWYFRLFLAGPLGRMAYYLAFASPLGRGIVDRILRRRQKSEADFTAAFGRVDHRVTLRYLRAFRRFGGVEVFRGLAQPIDIVRGDTTFKAVRESERIYAALWPRARVTVLQNSGHLPLIRAAPRLAAILCDANEPASPLHPANAFGADFRPPAGAAGRAAGG